MVQRINNGVTEIELLNNMTKIWPFDQCRRQDDDIDVHN